MREILTVSEQLKRRREAKGLSLSGLARRVGTSAATLSRYEHGWTRFETYTLRKLATALGCELQIELVARPGIPRVSVSRAKAVHQLRRLFWDHRLVVRDFDRHPLWMMERVLEYGALEDVRMVMEVFGKSRFLDMVAGVTRVSAKTAAFWRSLLEQEGVSCTKKFSRNTVWNY